MTDQNDAHQQSAAPAPAASAPRRKRRLRMLLWFLVAWAVAAYLIVPQLSELYFSHHKGFTEVDRVTRTSDDHPGDPINIALVGSDAEVVRAMTAAAGTRLTRSPSPPACALPSTRCCAGLTTTHR
jgi:hypothetical protein